MKCWLPVNWMRATLALMPSLIWKTIFFSPVFEPSSRPSTPTHREAEPAARDEDREDREDAVRFARQPHAVDHCRDRRARMAGHLDLGNDGDAAVGREPARHEHHGRRPGPEQPAQL